MFQNLRQNSQIYIFHKGNNPYLETGRIINISQPKPKYGVPPQFGQEMVIDIQAMVNGNTVNYNGLPAQSDIADTYLGLDQIVITDNREAMNSEVLAIKQKSEDILKSIDQHKGIITECDTILQQLNPEYAEKQQQQQEINSLKSQMSDITNTLELLIKELKEEKK